MPAVYGVQTPTRLHCPEPDQFSDKHGRLAIALAEGYGLKADEWQATVIKAWMRTDANGAWLADDWGLAVPRQNGKNGAVEIAELYMTVVMGLRVLHTAHIVSSAQKHFRRLLHFFGEQAEDPNAQYPELNELVKHIRRVNGQEAIVLKSGASIEMAYRSKNAGRGFTVDVLVMDEAQQLSDDGLEALLPTISAAPSGQPVTIYTGTPPGPAAEGDVFTRWRKSVIDGLHPAAAYVEWSADPGADLDDEDNWALTNPALGRRLNRKTIRAERQKFSEAGFARERLGLWPADGGVEVVPRKVWDSLAMEPEDEWPLAAIGIDMDPERTSVKVCMAVHSDFGQHLELSMNAPWAEEGAQALVETIFQAAKRRIPVVVDAFSPAVSLVPLMQKKRMRVFKLQGGEYVQACGAFVDALTRDRTLTHSGQEELTLSVQGLSKQKVGDGGGFKWSRKSIEEDISAAIAATCAFMGAIKFSKQRSNSSGSTRRAVAH